MDTDTLLKKFGLRYEDLNAVERETFNTQIQALQQGQLTLERLRESIHAMRESCIAEASHYENGRTQDIYLKARIRNYTLILSLFDGQEKARKALETALAGVK